MSIRTVVTRGFGNATFNGTIPLLVRRGYASAAAATTAAVTGTAAAGINESDVVAGGKTIIITLSNDSWVPSGAAFDAVRQDILNGLDSAQAEATGWNAVVRDAEVVTAVARTSNAVVTITLSAAPTYDITATETITVTVPSSALVTSLVDVVAAPTFTVSSVSVAPLPNPSIGPGGGPTYRYFTPISGRKKKRIDEVIAKETRLVKQFATYQERGADADLINDLLLRIREVQLLILRLALESEAAQNYIAEKRDEEELQDIKFILTVI